MRRALALLAAAVTLAALAAALWSAREEPAPRVIAPGQPVPEGDPVVLDFEDERWTLQRRETTREESLFGVEGERALPAPSPADPERPIDESARVLDDLGRAAWREGDLEGALAHFERAVAADPDDWLPRAHLGRLLSAGQEHNAALVHLERAAALAPDDPQRWLDLQTVYERSLEIGRALAARRRAEALAGGRPISRDWAGFWTIEGAESLP